MRSDTVVAGATRAAVLAVACLMAAAVPGPALAAGPREPGLGPPPSELDSGRLRGFAAQIDNDSLATWPHDDRWYTAGSRLQWVHESGEPDGWPATIAAGWCRWTGCGGQYRVYRLTTLGQTIFNPADTRVDTPQTDDRPYGAWLALGTGVLVREPDTLQRIEARIGVTGPAALGEPVQNRVHAALGLQPARGWEWQLRPRLGVQLGAARMTRAPVALSGVDWVGRVSADAGNLFVQAGAGAMLRWGEPPIAPGWPGEPPAPWSSGADGGAAGSWHLFGGVDVRAVAINRLIDGPTYGPRPAVRHEPVVGDVFAGAALRVARAWHVELLMTLRSLEFESAPALPVRDPQRFGTLLLRWTPH